MLEHSSRGTPLVINDVVLPNVGEVTNFEEHKLRQVDICMMVTLGAKQRSERHWKRLIKEANKRLKVVKVSKSTIGLGLLEVQLEIVD